MASQNFARLCTGTPLRVAQREECRQLGDELLANAGLPADTGKAVNDTNWCLAA